MTRAQAARHNWFSIWILAVASGTCYFLSPVQGQGVAYGVDSWDVMLGNHRALIRVETPADAVWVHIPWRRRDKSPQEKGIVVIDSQTREQIHNIARININQEFGDIVFQPHTVPGEYEIYYFPVAPPGPEAGPGSAPVYRKFEPSAEAEWLRRNGLTKQGLQDEKWRSLPRAEVIELQARTELDRFDPMEVIATASEVENLLAQYPQSSYLLFPENRRLPIRMTDNLPLCWVKRGPADEFHGVALRNEFFTFQIGVWAAREPVEDIAVRFSDLQGDSGDVIPAAACRCFNLGGIDALGHPFHKTITVPRGKVQALWCGIQVPKDISPGTYEGIVTVGPAVERESTTLKLVLEVGHNVLGDRGVSESWRHSRLLWLDSTLGIDHDVPAPYTPLKLHGRTVSCLGRELTFGATGLPESIRSGGCEILAEPIRLVVEAATGLVTWRSPQAPRTHVSEDQIVWKAHSTGDALSLSVWAQMEFDGYVYFRTRLQAERDISVSDIRLEIPLRREISTYMMGLNRRGGYRPSEWQWKWSESPNNHWWMGDVRAGLYCKLRGPRTEWEFFDASSHGPSGIPDSWANGGQGGCTISEEGEDQVVVRAYTGARHLQQGDVLELNFSLLITPVKPLDPRHWEWRYCHACISPALAKMLGAKIQNYHHATPINPWINYPFLTADRLKDRVRQGHDLGLKVKPYYTAHELSNHTPEIWALASLGYEILNPGIKAAPWVKEHLPGYRSRWYCGVADPDISIMNVGLSRWFNYYVEGLNWLLRETEIDGVYLDGIGFSRQIMKRVRKVLDRHRHGLLIDFHAGNNVTRNSNTLLDFAEHLPYIDSLWVGEGFNHGYPPDFWLVEMSGIPFGVWGEMLQGGGNPWRGMLYGMTTRYHENLNAWPTPMWDFWDKFGIQDAQMIGYWDESCPVKTDHPQVLATIYRKKRKTLVALASWAKEPVSCHLDINWKALGLDPAKSHLVAYHIPGFQHAALFSPGDAIPIPSAGEAHSRAGWLLVIDESTHQVPPEITPGKLELLEEELFVGDRLGSEWEVYQPSPDTRLEVVNEAMGVYGRKLSSVFAQRSLPPGTSLVQCQMLPLSDCEFGYYNCSCGAPGMAVVWPNGAVRISLRSKTKGRFGVDDGIFYLIQDPNGLHPNGVPSTKRENGVWYYMRIWWDDKHVYAEASEDGRTWTTIRALPRGQFAGEPISVRLGKMNRFSEGDSRSSGEPCNALFRDLRFLGKSSYDPG